MKRILLVLSVASLMVLTAAGAAYAVTKTCETFCKGTYMGDVLIGTSADTTFYGLKGGDRITDTAKADNDQVDAGRGNDTIDVRESGKAKSDADDVDCGKGEDTVYANDNDRIKANCELVYRS